MEKTVMLSAEERADFEAFKLEKAKKEAELKAKEERETYKTLVDDCIADAFPELIAVSKLLMEKKQKVMAVFNTALDMKADVFGVKNEQRSHTFTNSEGTRRIILGQYMIDDYRDTVSEGISLVTKYIESLARDDNSRALVKAVLRLLSRDQKGNLKASRVLQLRKMADDSGNAQFIKGVRIIEESYQPSVSKQYVRLDIKDEHGAWVPVPLGMTEA